MPKFYNSRVFTSLYEALSVQAQMTCEKKGMDYLPLWFLYSIVVMNILLVLNASSNFLIYLFAGNSFRDQVFYHHQDLHPDHHHCFAVQKNFCFLEQQRGLLSSFDSWQKPLQQVKQSPSPLASPSPSSSRSSSPSPSQSQSTTPRTKQWLNF